MAVIWQNGFDGSNGIGILPANSGNYGNPVASVEGAVVYSTAWSAAGSASALLGLGDSNDGKIAVEVAPQTDWSMRVYVMVPSGGYMANGYFLIDDEFDAYEAGAADLGAHAADLVDQPVRIEISRVGGTITYRLWWANPHSTGTPDYEHSEPETEPFDWMQFQGGYGVRSYIDELAIAQGEWIGPAVLPPAGSGPATGRIIIRGRADGRLTGLTPAQGRIIIRGRADGWTAQTIGATGRTIIRGHADGMAGPAVSDGVPPESMWLGPLGLLHEMAERGTWERERALAVAEHVSLQGRVTASRSLWSPRTTSLTWDRLEAADADALAEIAHTPAREDMVVAVIDPDAIDRNLFTAEQSRGRPLIGGHMADLYRLEGPGALVAGTVTGVRYVVVAAAQGGTDLTWLHPYWGERGWPVMEGWPVHCTVQDVPGGPGLHRHARLWLTWRDHAGAAISSAAGLPGSGHVEADAPAGAVSVQPHMRLTSAPGAVRIVGLARLTYAPHDQQEPVPLGNGTPAYAVTSLRDSPHLPYRTTTLSLQEVRAHAVR